MGRYAFFNTGMEYKFWFAIQNSSDILAFGGEGNGDYEDAKHEWTSDDLEYIHAKLVICAKENSLTLPDFTKFEKSLDGTYEIYELEFECVDEKIAAYFTLGCVIYHQLLYTPTLKARYEW
jgi:hypothetical protein